MATDNPNSGPVGNWLELSVEADAESVEAVSELISSYAYGQGVAVYEAYQQDPDGDNLRTDPNRPVTVVAYLPADDGSEDVIQKLKTGLWHMRQIGPIGPLICTERPEEDWANAWKEHFQVTRIGRRFVIRPTWREYSPERTDLVIDLDPGMAFGTGHHPTTELCLVWMEELEFAAKRVLDVGAGSGILSIAAVKLDARSVDAIEIDNVAARALLENLELNQVDDRVRVYVGDFEILDEPTGPYDVVVANIISSVLLKLVEPLTDAVATDGQLLLSGVIDRHLDAVVEQYRRQGMQLVEKRQLGDWFAILFVRDD